jgi:hypothetical protein
MRTYFFFMQLAFCKRHGFTHFLNGYSPRQFLFLALCFFPKSHDFTFPEPIFPRQTVIYFENETDAHAGAGWPLPLV